jgi:hypothetical protein
MVTQKFKDERIAGFTATTEEFRVSQMPRIRENISEGLKGKVSRRNRGIEPWNLVMGGCGSLGQHYVGCSIAKIWSNDVSGWEDYWLGTRMSALRELAWIYHANRTMTPAKFGFPDGAKYLAALLLMNDVELAKMAFEKILPITWRTQITDYNYSDVGLEPMLICLLGRRFNWQQDYPVATLGRYSPIIEQWDDRTAVLNTLRWMADDRVLDFKVEREWMVASPMPLCEVPVEILTVYRVRADLGYETPRFEHKILYEPFCNIPANVVRTTDPQLPEIVAWVHRQYPELGDLHF